MAVACWRKDVGKRVRRGVEEVFNGLVFFSYIFLHCLRMYFLDMVSLKTKLAAVDLHRLISDVRRRVEHEITFEGNEKRTTYVIFPMAFAKLHADPHVHFSDLSPLFFHPHPRRSMMSFTRRIYSLKLRFSPSHHLRKSSISPKTSLRLFDVLRVIATVLQLCQLTSTSNINSCSRPIRYSCDG